MLKIFLLIFTLWGGAGGASNLYNIISIHSEKNVGWILHEDNGPNHPMIHLNVKCGYIL